MAERGEKGKPASPVDRARDSGIHNSTRFYDSQFRVTQVKVVNTGPGAMRQAINTLKTLIPGWKPPPLEDGPVDIPITSSDSDS